jgi:PKD repeat protein
VTTLRQMRCVLVVAVFFVLTSPAHAAPNISITPSAVLGQAPLAVTLTATGEADSYSWDLGDGSRAEGPVVHHTYATGRHRATLTATLRGETARTTVTIVAAKLVLAAPHRGTYGRRTTVRGRIIPALRRAWIALQSGSAQLGRTRTDRAGRFRFHPRLGRPAPFHAAFGSIVSNPVTPAVRPRLDLSLPRARMVGRRLVFRARLVPADAGSLRIRIWREGRAWTSRSLGSGGSLRLPSGRAAGYVVQVSLAPANEFARVRRTLRATVHVPQLAPGSRGPSVRLLESRLRELRFALKGVDGLYAHDTYEAVIAFQKLHGLARTGRVGPGLWSRLRSTAAPRPRYGGTHLEVSKGRQLLFDVRDGRVMRVVHVSTGATGNTPIGRWRIYRKVGGWDWVLWYPMYFLRGFAVHGYPSVPTYPASHGCVRVPMWIARTLFADHPYGRTIYVY